MRIKKRSDGKYDLGQNVRVPGKKTPRFKVILHLGKSPTIDDAIEAQRRDRRDPRRKGESQIDGEMRRARAKLIIERLETMKIRAQDEAGALARKLVQKVVLHKMKREASQRTKAELKRKELHHEESQAAPGVEIRSIYLQQQMSAHLVAEPVSEEAIERAASRKRTLQSRRTRVLGLKERAGNRRSVLARCNDILNSIDREIFLRFPPAPYKD